MLLGDTFDRHWIIWMLAYLAATGLAISLVVVQSKKQETGGKELAVQISTILVFGVPFLAFLLWRLIQAIGS